MQKFFLTASGDQSTCHVIPIALTDGKLLVAVPSSAWHRTVARRFLPPKSLSKAVLIELPEEAPVMGEVVRNMQVWVGLLNSDLVSSLTLGHSEDLEACDFADPDGLVCMPLTSSLVEVSNDQFAFHSATSHGPEDVKEAAKPLLENRVGALAKMQSMLEALPAQIAGVKNDRVPALRASPKPTFEVDDFVGLDPGVVASARQAGVPDSQLAKIAKLMGKKPNLGELPKTRSKVVSNVLSESEDEDDVAEEEEAAGGSSPSAAVERAVVQLTKLVSNLTKKKKSSSGIDGIFEKLESSAGEASSSSGSGRSKAAVYQKLKAALVEKPEWLYTSIEQNMEEDFQVLRSSPSSSHMATLSRGWVEHRSRIATVRFAWVVAGIHDALRQGEFQQARARAALALAAIDQSALDAGGWGLAQEFLLELPPPYGSFTNRRMPDPSEQVATRLADDRFVDTMMWKLKDRDSYLESRKRLSQNSGNRAKPPPPGPSPKQPGTPKAKAKARSSAAGGEDTGGGAN